jgi:glycosyl transferase family 25
MFEFVEKVVYINLNERTDRRAAVEAELLRVFPAERVERFEAIRTKRGGIGCGLSHIGVLERAKAAGWANVLVVEDDLTWVPEKLAEADARFQAILATHSEDWDVILLSGTYADCAPDGRVRASQSAMCYLVNAAYYDTLIATLREGVENLIRNGDYKIYAIDQYWKRLQARDRWWMVLPMACYQRPDFSNIEGRGVDYRRCFFAKVR